MLFAIQIITRERHSRIVIIGKFQNKLIPHRNESEITLFLVAKSKAFGKHLNRSARNGPSHHSSISNVRITLDGLLTYGCTVHNFSVA
jgi:hypothetical protein